MAELGLCSRREADDWIARGWVHVNGQPAALGQPVEESDRITIERAAQQHQQQQVTILLHKPVGYVSGQAEDGHAPAVTLVQADRHWRGDPSRLRFAPSQLRGLAPAGRLDIDSTGLLVLTQDGRVAKRLIGEDSDAEKEYLVRVSGEMIPRGLELLRHGLELDGKPLKPAWVKQLNEKRQIRRMCELVGLRALALKRVRIGRVMLGDLPPGTWRYLGPDEKF